jgi:hypothetical protein
MIVDFRNSANRVYFNGILPTYSTYMMRLVANYSNKEILNNSFGSVVLSGYSGGGDWFSFRYASDITPLQNVELNNYYTCELIGVSGSGNTETIIQKNLCKVLNNFDTTNTNYISDNEDNEQYIYFIND